ncbi:SOS response-associated peptidase [Evansella halocellulosilytica]|uniref:SOS response-associated peptidase n=1 Tax=Evansella halocellulosilytica TaxID=2011013 RepID=UPI000BB752D7|nr:SOS response-associated peptidase [Evansella halocellulosilytica]
MCGRFTLYADPEFIQDELDIENEDWKSNLSPSYNVAPTQQVLTIVKGKKKSRAGLMKWGLIPFWAKDASVGYKMINARCETIFEKPSYKHLVNKRHCIIVANGFYEWKKENNKKQPYYIQSDLERPLLFAGLWDRYVKGEQTFITCTIITRQANEKMEKLHHRMPVILHEGNWKNWLHPSDHSFEQLNQAFFNEDVSLHYFPVSTKVNKPINNSVDCLNPL